MNLSHVLLPYVFTICVRHLRHLALNHFVTCPSSLKSRSYCLRVLVFRKVSNLGLRLCGSVPENCLGHSVFEIVDVLRRVCDQDVSGQVTCFFAKMM